VNDVNDTTSIDATVDGMIKAAQAMAADQKKARNPSTEERVENYLKDRVTWSGTKMVLPADPSKMTVKDARKHLDLLEADMNAEMTVNEVIDAFPLEGANAFSIALARRYGWAQSVPTPGFFGPQPPQIISMPIGVGQTRQVIWGSFSIPGIDGHLQCAAVEQYGRRVFVTAGTIKKHCMEEVKLLADMTRQIVREESVYRGQAINLVMNNGRIDYDDPPTFIDTSKVDASQVVFGPTLQRQIDTSIFAPLRHTDACRKAGIPLKRGVLLEGPYGCGKTLVSYVTAQEATRTGWTYVSIKDARGLDEAIRFARQYQPAVVFCEDVDREMAGEDRTHAIDDILNTIDGIESKGTDIMVILTSNHADEINAAMLRPGRLDAVIRVSPPDATAAARLVGIYGGSMIVAGEDLAPVGERLNGRIPAVIREVVERSKLHAINRAGGISGSYVTAGDLLDAAAEMNSHLALLEKPRDEPTPAERLAKALKDVITGAGGLAPESHTAEILELSREIRSEV
jgi:transitional endoplasmic reticulum ATPase